MLDWQEREHSDYIFGAVKGKNRWIKIADVEDKFLKTGWSQETEDGEAIQSYTASINNGWTADQVWGFQNVNGERRYVRLVVVVKGDKRIERKLVYDWQK